MAAHDLDQRALAVGPGAARGARAARRRRATKRRAGQTARGQRAPLGRDPEDRLAASSARPRAAPRPAPRTDRRARARALGLGQRAQRRAADRAARRRRADRACASATTAAMALGIEPADRSTTPAGSPRRTRDRARAALLERRVVEEGVGVGVQDLVREHRRLGQLARRASGSRPSRDRLEHARAARRRPSPRAGSRAASRAPAGGRAARWRRRRGCPGRRAAPGNTAASRSCRAHALERRRHALARPGSAAARASASRSSASASRTSAPAARPASAAPRRPPARSIEKTVSSGKLCCGPSESTIAVVGGRRLQLEVEAAAEALAQRQAPGAVDAPAERRVDDELHAARLVEEALGDHASSCVGTRAERRARPRAT